MSADSAGDIHDVILVVLEQLEGGQRSKFRLWDKLGSCRLEETKPVV